MRAIWSGSISFGLVNIPVKLYSAVQSNELNFDMLSKKDMSPIRYARISTKSGKEIKYQDIVKGFEYKKGQYVVVTDEDFKKASPKKSQLIEIQSFAKTDEINPIYYEKPYVLLPVKGSEKSYFLLLKALQKAKKVGVAEFMLRNREHICALEPYNDVLLLHQLRYDSEMKIDAIENKMKDVRISSKEMQLAVKLIDQLSEAFDPLAHKDSYVSALKRIIKAKASGKKIKIPEYKTEDTNIRDLMTVLKESVSSKSGSTKRKKVA
jgi:DNA end-binding protein Ku